MSDVLTWVNVAGGSEKPHWVYVVLRFKDGTIDFDRQPRWAAKQDAPLVESAHDRRRSRVAGHRKRT